MGLPNLGDLFRSTAAASATTVTLPSAMDYIYVDILLVARDAIAGACCRANGRQCAITRTTDRHDRRNIAYDRGREIMAP